MSRRVIAGRQDLQEDSPGQRALVFVVAQGEMPVAREPHHDPQHDHEEGCRIGQGDEADDADECEYRAHDSQDHAAEDPEAPDRKDRDADYGERRFRLLVLQ
jgi:hypothetical protein